MASILEHHPLGKGYVNLGTPPDRPAPPPHPHGQAVMGELTLPPIHLTPSRGGGGGGPRAGRDEEGGEGERRENRQKEPSLGLTAPPSRAEESVAPPDSYNLIYISLLFSGVGFLLPYDSFILAVDYYQERFKGTFDTVVFDMSLTYIICAFVAVAFTNALVRTYTLQARITFGYILAFSILLFISYFDIYQERFEITDSYHLTLGAVGVVAVGCTVQQSSFYGFTSMLPQRYTQGVMTGESAAGLIISINRIITKWALKDSRKNTLIFFFLSLGFLVFCCITFHILLRTEFIRHYVGVCQKAAELERSENASSRRRELTEELGLVDVGNDEGESSTSSFGRNKESYGVLDVTSPTTAAALAFDGTAATSEADGNSTTAASMRVPPPRPSKPPTITPTMTDANGSAARGGGGGGGAADVSSTSASRVPTGYVSFPATGGEDAAIQVSTAQAEALHVEMRANESLYSSRWSRWKISFKRGLDIRTQASCPILCHMYSIAMAYFVTLALFPGIESEIKSCSLQSWLPVIIMATFNLFDFIGKILAAVPTDLQPIQIAAFASARILLIPLIMMCAWPRTDPIFKGDGWSIFFTSLLGISNGYFGSVPMIMAPSRVPDEFKELGGNIMMWSYSVGLTTGSIIAYSLNDWLGPRPKVDICSLHNDTILQQHLDILPSTLNGSDLIYGASSNDSLSPDDVAAEMTSTASSIISSTTSSIISTLSSAMSSMTASNFNASLSNIYTDPKMYEYDNNPEDAFDDS